MVKRSKKYQTEGRTLYNYRGRNGRLTIVPTRKSETGFAVCDTYGIACRVLEAAFDDDVVELGTEPPVDHEGLPTGRMHLDLRERRKSGWDHYVEVKAAQFMTPEAVQRLSIMDKELVSRGETLEVVLRDDVVERVKANALQFLYRFRAGWQPAGEQLTVVLKLCNNTETLPLSEWLASFHAVGLEARSFYWALAYGHLRIVDVRGLFPNGLVSGVLR